ncbi:hypothetical protein [Leifsonia tongyongensis]|nr:hypothetical protein [Diaminobutyricibacter tongyongensis]
MTTTSETIAVSLDGGPCSHPLTVGSLQGLESSQTPLILGF